METITTTTPPDGWLAVVGSVRPTWEREVTHGVVAEVTVYDDGAFVSVWGEDQVTALEPPASYVIAENDVSSWAEVEDFLSPYYPW